MTMKSWEVEKNKVGLLNGQFSAGSSYMVYVMVPSSRYRLNYHLDWNGFFSWLKEFSILRISGISDRKGNQGEELRTEVVFLYNVALHP